MIRIAEAPLGAKREMMNNLPEGAGDILASLPMCLLILEMLRTGQFGCSNAGILGGQDIDFFHTNGRDLRFVNRNGVPSMKGPKYMSSTYSIIVYEQ